MVRRLAEREGETREFLMRVTHDLRTPLTAIRGHAAALSDGVVPADDVPRSLAAIEGEAARLESARGRPARPGPPRRPPLQAST